MGASEYLWHIGRPVLDYVLPPRCPGCGAIVQDNHQFCTACWSELELLGDPCCACCGAPFAHDMGEGALCGACLADPPGFTAARAALAYGPHSRAVAIRLKYGRRLGLARLMAEHMARRLPAGARADPSQWLIVPVPLHRWRLWSRGFNQSALLARHLARLSAIAENRYALLRTRATRPLRAMSPVARARMVRGAFACDPDHVSAIRGRHIILVDDIHTSGATAQACAKTLFASGARSVHLLCWARVLHKKDEPPGVPD